jgi:hypothetical protein
VARESKSCSDGAPEPPFGQHRPETAVAAARARLVTRHGGGVRDLAPAVPCPGEELASADEGTTELGREMHVEGVPGGGATAPRRAGPAEVLEVNDVRESM